jgi:hypothetical protein
MPDPRLKLGSSSNQADECPRQVGTLLRRADGVNDKVMGLIQKLRDQAAGTDYEAESQTFIEKAQELMVRYAVEQADLDARGRATTRPDVVAERFRYVTSAHPDRNLLSYVAVAADCRLIIHSQGRTTTQATLVGQASDIAFTRALYASLLIQREAALARADRGYDNGRSFNHSFRQAFAVRVSRRLQESKQRVQTRVAGSELVLPSKGDAANRKVAELFPQVKPMSGTRTASSAGRSAGDRAGQTASLTRPGTELREDHITPDLAGRELTR